MLVSSVVTPICSAWPHDSQWLARGQPLVSSRSATCDHLGACDVAAVAARPAVAVGPAVVALAGALDLHRDHDAHAVLGVDMRGGFGAVEVEQSLGDEPAEDFLGRRACPSDGPIADVAL